MEARADDTQLVRRHHPSNHRKPSPIPHRGRSPPDPLRYLLLQLDEWLLSTQWQ